MSTLKNLWQKKRWIFWLLIVALLCVPPMLKILGIYKIKALYLRYACNIMMYATLAGSLNVINGYSGQTCLGQAGFFAIGAYTCAILSTRLGVSFWVLLPLCGLASGLIGLLVSLPTLRLQGIYLSIVTLGASEIIRIIAQTASITGGWVALHDALMSWVKAGHIHRLPLKDQVAAVSCGVVAGELLCDLDYPEDSSAELDLNLVGTGSGQLVEIQGTGEKAPFDRATLNSLLDMGEAAIKRLVALQNEVTNFRTE